jgi:hypothetical protein
VPCDVWSSEAASSPQVVRLKLCEVLLKGYIRVYVASVLSYWYSGQVKDVARLAQSVYERGYELDDRVSIPGVGMYFSLRH